VKLEQVQRTGIRDLSEEKNPFRALGWDALPKLAWRAERRGDGVVS